MMKSERGASRESIGGYLGGSLGGVDGDMVWDSMCRCLVMCYDFSDPVKTYLCLEACLDGVDVMVIDVACRGGDYDYRNS